MPIEDLSDDDLFKLDKGDYAGLSDEGLKIAYAEFGGEQQPEPTARPVAEDDGKITTDIAKSFGRAGLSLLSGAGNAAEWAGLVDSNPVKEFVAKKEAEWAMPEQYMKDLSADPSMILDKRWWAINAPGVAVTALPFMVPAVGGAAGAYKLARLAKLGQVGLGRAMAAGATGASALSNSLFEGSLAYGAALEAGGTKEQASDVAAKTARKNFAWTAVTSGAGLFNPAITGAIKKIVVSSVLEGLQEVGEERIAGKELQQAGLGPDPGWSLSAGVLGAVGGAGMDVAFGAMRPAENATEKQAKDTITAQATEELIANGVPENIAPILAKQETEKVFEEGRREGQLPTEAELGPQMTSPYPEQVAETEPVITPEQAEEQAKAEIETKLETPHPETGKKPYEMTPAEFVGEAVREAGGETPIAQIQEAQRSVVETADELGKEVPSEALPEIDETEPEQGYAEEDQPLGTAEEFTKSFGVGPEVHEKITARKAELEKLSTKEPQADEKQLTLFQEKQSAIGDAISKQLTEAGYSTEEVEANSKIASGLISGIAKIAGVDPDVAFEKYGLKIQREGKESKTEGKELDQNARANIKFSPEGVNINLLPKADKSSFIHEISHFMLEFMGDLSETSPEVKAEYDKILNWVGVKSRDEIKTEHHEKLAKGMERYVGEGKAPTEELKSAFEMFKQWMAEVYGELKKLGVKFSKEVTEVMDNILIASDREVKPVEGQIVGGQDISAEAFEKISDYLTAGDGKVTARINIEPGPLEKSSRTIKAGETGHIQDSDRSEKVLFVEFGTDIVTVTVDELKESYGMFRKELKSFEQESIDQTKTPEFKKWFGKSKVVDEKGKPLVVYHGTAGTFTEFKKSKSNVESDFGAGFYFTNERGDVAENYAGFGADLTNRIERRAEEIEQEREGEVDHDESIRIAKQEMTQNQGATVPVYLRINKPFIVGGKNETILDIEYVENKDGDIVDEKGPLFDFIVALKDIASSYHDYGRGEVDGVIGSIMDQGGGITASKLYEIVNSDEKFNYFTDENGKLVSKEILRAAIEKIGFDGIADRTVHGKFGPRKIKSPYGTAVSVPGMQGMGPDTTHYVAFNPTQIKSAIGNSGKFDPKRPSILEQSPLEPRIPINPQAFADIVKRRRLGPGSNITVKTGFTDKGIGHLSRGRKGKVLGIDIPGGRVLAEFNGEPVIVNPLNLVETFVKPEQEKPLPIKKQIAKSSGMEKDAEADLLKLKLSSEERGSKIGARFAAREERAKILTDWNDEKKNIALVKSAIVKYVRTNVPADLRGKFLTIVENAKTETHMIQAFWSADQVASDAYRKGLISDIRKLVTRALASAGVAVEFKTKINSLMENIELKGHRPETLNRLRDTKEYIEREQAKARAEGREIDPSIEMPQGILDEIEILSRKALADVTEVELEELVNTLETYEQHGRKAFISRQHIAAMQKERIAKELIAGLRPIEKAERIERKPGELLDNRAKLKNALAAISDKFQNVHMAILPSDVLFDLMGKVQGFAGAPFRLIKKALDADYSAYLNRVDEWVKPVEDLRLKLNLSDINGERIGIHATRMQRGGMDKLLQLGLDQKYIDSIKLTPEENKAYKFMREQIEKPYPYTKQLIAELYNMDLGKVDNYFPFQSDPEAMSDLDVTQRFGEMSGFSRLSKTEEKGSTIKRVGGKQKIRINAFDAFDIHMTDSAYLISTQKNVKMLFEIVNSPAFGVAAGEVGQRIALQWLDVVAKNGGASDAGKPLVTLDMWRRNIGAATMGFKLSSILVQTTSLFDAAAMIGGNYVRKGLQRTMFDSEFRKFLIDNMPELRDRIIDSPDFAEMAPSKFMAKYQKKGFAALQWMDSLVATATAAGAYQKWLDQNGKTWTGKAEKEGIEYATLAMRRTQSSPMFKDTSLALSRGALTGNRSIDKMLLQYQSFMLNRWSYIEHDLIRLGLFTPGGNKSDAAWSLAYLTMAQFAEMGIRGGSRALVVALLGGSAVAIKDAFDGNDDEWKYTKQVLSNVPFAGQFIQSAIYGSNPVPTIQTIESVYEGVGQTFKAKKTKTALRGATKAISSIARLMGIPGTAQAQDMGRVLMADNKLKFPFQKEHSRLKELSKSGTILDHERQRLNTLNGARARYEARNLRFKAAMDREDTEGAEKEAASMAEDMERYAD